MPPHQACQFVRRPPPGETSRAVTYTVTLHRRSLPGGRAGEPTRGGGLGRGDIDGTTRAVAADEFEAQVANHAPVLVGGLPQRGQVVPDEETVGPRPEDPLLKLADAPLAAAGDLDFLSRQEEAEHGRDLQAFHRREGSAVAQRRAFHGDQKLSGTTGRPARGLERRSAVGPGLTHRKARRCPG